MARTDPQINIRIPADLKRSIEVAAVANNRSMNAEIVARLLASFEPGIEANTAQALRQMMDEQEKRLLDEVKAGLSRLEANLKNK